MLTVQGIYQNGRISLRQPIRYETQVKVLVIFLDDLDLVETNKPAQKSFSFRQAREHLKQYTGSLSDAVLEERRQAL